MVVVRNCEWVPSLSMVFETMFPIDLESAVHSVVLDRLMPDYDGRHQQNSSHRTRGQCHCVFVCRLPLEPVPTDHCRVLDSISALNVEFYRTWKNHGCCYYC
jgi:hypothetical protein